MPAPAAGTATGTPPRNVDGVAIALTVFSTVRWWGRLWLPLLFLGGRLLPQRLAPLLKLSFIHFARWTLVTKLEGRRLRYAHLYFESNFNGGWEQYIDAFAYVLGSRMVEFWGSSYGFPKPLPTGPFKDYIRRGEVVASHFYSAYPEATTTMVAQALELDGRLAPLKARAAQLGPDEFAAAWREFLTAAQGDL